MFYVIITNMATSFSTYNMLITIPALPEDINRGIHLLPGAYFQHHNDGFTLFNNGTTTLIVNLFDNISSKSGIGHLVIME